MNASTDRKTESREVSRQSGFTLLELTIVLAISLVVAGIAIPRFVQTMRNLRLSGDGRNIAETLGQAKMRAAADFTDARAYFDFGTGTYRVDVWDKTLAPGGCWRLDAANAGCIGPGGAVPGMNLSANVTFGFGAVGAAPPNVAGGIAQAPGCFGGGPGGATPPLNPWQGGAIGNTACVVFNSRGVPIDNTLAATPNNVIYLTDAANVYGLTVSQTGLIRTWSTPANVTGWLQR